MERGWSDWPLDLKKRERQDLGIYWTRVTMTNTKWAPLTQKWRTITRILIARTHTYTQTEPISFPFNMRTPCPLLAPFHLLFIIMRSRSPLLKAGVLIVCFPLKRKPRGIMQQQSASKETFSVTGGSWYWHRLPVYQVAILYTLSRLRVLYEKTFVLLVWSAMTNKRLLRACVRYNIVRRERACQTVWLTLETAFISVGYHEKKCRSFIFRFDKISTTFKSCRSPCEINKPRLSGSVKCK